jgi:hypothetical protein
MRMLRSQLIVWRRWAVVRTPLPAVSSGCAMRIVALDDDDHTRLRTAMESLLDRVPSSKGPSLGLNAALYVAGENSLFTS